MCIRDRDEHVVAVELRAAAHGHPPSAARQGEDGELVGMAGGHEVVPVGRQLPADWHDLMAARHADEFTVLALARGRRWMAVRRGSEFNSYHVLVPVSYTHLTLPTSDLV